VQTQPHPIEKPLYQSENLDNMDTKKLRTRRGKSIASAEAEIWEGNPTLSGIFVSFLCAVSDSEATWYSLKPMHDTPYIGDILGLSSDNTFSYLAILGLCHQRNDGSYAMKKDGLQSFYHRHFLQDVTQFAQFRNNESWIRIGTAGLDGIPPPAHGVPAPRMPLLRRRQGLFLDGLQRALLAAGASKGEELLPQPVLSTILSIVGTDTQTSTSTTSTTGGIHQDNPHNNAIASPPAPLPTIEDIFSSSKLLQQIRCKLLPLLLNEGYEPQFNAQLHVHEVVDTLLDMVDDHRRLKNDQLSVILGKAAIVTPEKHLRFTPLLSSYGVPTNLRAECLRDLHQLHRKEEPGSNILSYRSLNNVKVQLVHIPRGPLQYKHFRPLAERVLADVLTVLAADRQQKSDVMNDLLRVVSSVYPNEWEEALTSTIGTRRIPKMDAASTVAVQSLCNLSGQQMRMLHRCLRAELGQSPFASLNATNQLLLLHSNNILVEAGTYQDGSESIEFTYQSLVDTLRFWLSDLASAGRPIGRVDISCSMDHGKGFSRASVLFINRFWSASAAGGGKWDKIEHVVSVGNACCRKDNAEIIMNTYGNYLEDELQYLQDAGKALLLLGNDHKVVVEEPISETTLNDVRQFIPVELFMSGDLLFYSMALGKENMAPHWCPYCDCRKSSWQSIDHERANCGPLKALPSMQGTSMQADNCRLKTILLRLQRVVWE
jgi:hypothetical protein